MSPLLAVPLPDLGHLLPMLAVLDRLVKAGERVIVAGLLDREQLVKDAGFEFVPLMAEQMPLGWLNEISAQRSAATSGAALNSINLKARAEPFVEALLADLPNVVKKQSPRGLIIDPYHYGAASVAASKQLPAIAIDGALTSLRMPGMPEPFLPWALQKETGWLSALQYALLGRGTDRAMRPVLRSLNQWRTAHGLPALASVFSECDKLTRLCQHTQSFEPGSVTGEQRVHYLGPFHAASGRPPADFPWERLDDRPLVYASVGTIAAPGKSLFELIADACAKLDLQLVIGLGGDGRQLDVAKLAGNPIVVAWAPQTELLERSALCITHAGLNTTLESLSKGVPLVALPIAFDQPGVAWRIQRSGSGRVVPAEDASANKLRAAISEVLTNPHYAQKARALAEEMCAAGGADEAARIIAAEVPQQSR